MSISKKTAKTLNQLQSISKTELSLGNLLRAIRLGDDMSQVKFAEKLGISKQYLCDLEHERRHASPQAAAGYAEKLGYSIAQFVRLCLQDMLDRSGIRLSIEAMPMRQQRYSSTYSARL